MIPPIIAAQTSSPVANVQQNAESQGMLHHQVAQHRKQENERQIRESVVQKEEAVFYQPRYDAKEEGKNKYENLYNKKKKKKEDADEEAPKPAARVNFDIKIWFITIGE